MSDGVELKFNDKAFKQAMKKAPVEVGSSVSKAVQRAALETADKVREAAPKAFSTLTQSIKADRLDPFSYRVAPHVKYAQAVEFGRPAGKIPPVNDIFQWAKIKRLADDDTTLRSIAWSIAKKIGREGQKFLA